MTINLILKFDIDMGPKLEHEQTHTHTHTTKTLPLPHMWEVTK